MPLPVGKLEPEFLAELLGGLHADDPAVIVGPGIGRDVTVLAWDANERYLIAKTDPITFATDAIGYYAVNVNANDVATSGGVPRWFPAAPYPPEPPTSWCAQYCADRRHLPRMGISWWGHTEVTTISTAGAGRLHAGQVGKSELVVGDGAQ